jgi:hypothetical protein
MAKDRKKPASRKVTWDTVREVCGALPDAEESTSYGTPALKVRGTLFVRLKEDGETVVVRMDLPERAVRIAAEPDVFFVTDHYVGYPYVLVRLAAVSKGELREVLRGAWETAGGT